VLSYALLAHGAPLTRSILGMSSDPLQFVWCLAWWPHALLYHLNPLHPRLVWQPAGVDLVWMTSVPVLALLMAPVTLCWGALLSYNLLTIAAPVLAACAAYALCLVLTRRPGAAFCGGLAYGFCTYEMAETLEHLTLDFTLMLPLLLLIVLLRLADRLSRLRAAGLFALGLAVQFYISMEVALTSLVFGGVAWALALAFFPARRVVLRRLVLDGVVAGLLALPLLAPYLWDIVTTKRDIFVPENWSYIAAARAGGLLVTTPPVVMYSAGVPAGNSWLLRLPQHDFTTGLPILLLLAAFFWAERRTARARLLGWLLLVIFACALGPQLWLGGRFTGVVLPWRLMLDVPLLGAALPVRFLLQASLLVAVVLAIWVSRSENFWRKAAVCAAVGVTLMAPHVATPVPFSSFFRPGVVQAALGARARVLILPRETADASSFWQAQAGFGFSQTEGYLGMPPVAALSDAGVRDLILNHAAPRLGAEIAVLAARTGTQYVLAGPGTAAAVLAQVRSLGWKVRQVDDTLVFTVPGSGE
jgi:hypothetical protein